MAKQSIDQVDVAGRRVLMRVDFNVPLDGQGRITDDRRIRLALPSIRSVIDRRGRLVLMSHLGRPQGSGPEPGLGLAPVAVRLGGLLGKGARVHFVPGDAVGAEAARAAAALRDGEVLLLENLRFHAGEKEGDAAFARKLAALGEIYCNEAFGTAHRADASMVAVPALMAGRPRTAGLLLRRELRYLSEAIERGAASGGAFVAVLGGVKVSDKLGAIRSLLGRVDRILVGGAMAYTFLRGQGRRTGASLVEEGMIDEARAILAEATPPRASIELPGDHVCARAVERGATTRVFEGDIGEGWIGLDVGPATARRYAERVRGAETIVWNGPLGMVELSPFDAGSRLLAEAIAAATEEGATSVIGGGDSAAAVEAFGLADRVSHVSTGGGAGLQMLEGRSFESVELLDEEGTPAAV